MSLLTLRVPLCQQKVFAFATQIYSVFWIRICIVSAFDWRLHPDHDLDPDPEEVNICKISKYENVPSTGT
jgi:hypothetical protein